ncbi:MAG TPA: Ig-like domain-containing protein, partial [Bacillota bacterium]|nr:Ig-like domain-containing protein [Bacillota bacterium]
MKKYISTTYVIKWKQEDKVNELFLVGEDGGVSMVQLYQRVSPGLRAVVIFILSAVILFSYGLVVNATDSGPLLSGFLPAPGTNLSQTGATVSFKAYDPDGLDDATIQLKVNGALVSATVKHTELGYWETVTVDSCSPYTYERWVSTGTDPNEATISATVKAADSNTVELTAADKLGKVSTAQWNFNCMLPPVISSVLPGDRTFQSAVPVISAKITDNGEINAAAIIMKIGSEVCPAVFSADTGVVSYTPAEPLGEGTYTLYLEAKDIKGNTQTSTTTFTISSDTNGPVLAGFSPADGTALTSTAAAISFTATDPQEIQQASIQVKVNGATVPHTVTYKEIGHWETQTIYPSCSPVPYTTEVWIHEGYDYTTATIKASVKASDHNAVTVTAKDKLGNPSTTQWGFNCMLNPVIGSNLPAGGTVQTFVPRVSAVVTDNGPIDAASIILKKNSTVVPHSFNPTTGMITYIPQIPLPVGNYTFNLELKDAAGNAQTSAWSFQVVTDGNGPVISGITPANGGSINTTTTKYTFKAVDYDGINNTSVRIVVNGTELPSQSISVAYGEIGHYEDRTEYDSCTGEPYIVPVWVVDGADPNTVTVTTNLTGLPDVNYVSATIADKLGDSTVVNTSFNTTVPPSFSGLTPANGALSMDLQPTISALITDNASIDPASIVLRVNGSVYAHTFTSAGPKSGTVSYKPAAPLPNGVNNISLEAKDGLGNLATTAWRISVGPGKAVFSDPKPSLGSTVTIPNPEVGVTATDEINITSISMAINGQIVP